MMDANDGMRDWVQDFARQAGAILAELLPAGEAAEVAEMLAGVAARMGGGPAGVPWWPRLAGREAADPADLTDEQRAAVAAQFKDGEACPHCGGLHVRACPRVKRLVLHGEEISEVEFWPPGQWPETDVLWPEDFPVG